MVSAVANVSFGMYKNFTILRRTQTMPVGGRMRRWSVAVWRGRRGGILGILRVR